MSTTLIPDKHDAAVDSDESGDSDDAALVIDCKEIPTTVQRPPTEQVTVRPSAPRWWLIGGLVGGSIVLATAAMVAANVLAKRGARPRHLFGVRPVRRFGMRHVATPRGGTAWLAYTYRLPDLRVRLPEMTLPKMTLPTMAVPSVRGHHR
jgi:hypothetical protein